MPAPKDNAQSHGAVGEDGLRTRDRACPGAELAGLCFSHPACLEHDPRVHMPEHPDTPERLQAIEHALAAPTGLAGSDARPRRRGSPSLS